jgi:hypothetical protein
MKKPLFLVGALARGAPVMAALLVLTTLSSSFAAETKSPNCQTGSATIQGSADWTQISANVAPNVSVSITAASQPQWNCYLGVSTCWSGADGLSQNPPNVTDPSVLTLPSATVGTLIGKIGSDPTVRALNSSQAFFYHGQQVNCLER